jgi:hypothetical protein
MHPVDVNTFKDPANLNTLHPEHGTRWHNRLTHRATSRKVSGSITDGVTGIFDGHKTSDRTMALGSTQLLTEMSTGNISWAV